jgi:glycosyltransferase involved in cell wall biosynthesis
MIKTGILCCSEAWGELEMNILNLAKWLNKRGHQISVFCRNGSTISQQAKAANITTHHYTCKGKHFNFKAARRLARLLDQTQVPTLLIGHYEQFYIGIMSKRYSQQPLKTVYLQQVQMKHRKRDVYHQYFYKRLDAWVVPLEILKKQLQKNTGMAEHKVHVIPLAIELDRFTNALQYREESRKALEIPSNAFVAGIIGHLAPEKGQEYLIEAVEILENQDLHIYGLCIYTKADRKRAGYLRYLEKMAVERHLMDLIHFRPFAEDTLKALAALDVFVMGSRSETFGMATIEAMAAGLPVIGTKAGGTTELLDNGNAGLLIPPENEQAMADALKKIYQDDKLREQLIARGQQRVRENYSHIAQCEQIEALFDSL